MNNSKKIIIYTLLMLIFILSDLKASGVGSGAADVNARYLDGYGTAIATSSNKIYISDASGYLPDGSIDTGSILDGTIVNADVNNSAAIDVSKISDARVLTSASTEITVTTTMCSSAPCGVTDATCTKICTSQGYVSCDHYAYSNCNSSAWNAPKSWNTSEGTWSTGSACAYFDGSWSGSPRITTVTCYR